MSAQLAVHRQEKIGHSWQEASFVIVYLFCVQPRRYKCLFDSSLKTNGAQTGGREKAANGVVTLAARVMLRSFITSSNAAVSSACFWLCKAIFSLNFRGLFEVAMFRSSAPFSFNGQRQVTRREDAQLPVREADTTQSVKTEYPPKKGNVYLLFLHPE